MLWEEKSPERDMPSTRQLLKKYDEFVPSLYQYLTSAGDGSLVPVRVNGAEQKAQRAAAFVRELAQSAASGLVAAWNNVRTPDTDSSEWAFFEHRSPSPKVTVVTDR